MTVWNKIKAFIEKNEVLILLVLMVVVLRIPSLFEPNRYADEDIYLTLGQGLKKGLVFYRDIHDNKPPLLYVMAAVAGNVKVFRFILMIWNALNVVLIWKLAEKLIKKRWGIILSVFVFSVLSSIPLIEGNIANGEIFMIMPVTAAVLLLVDTLEKEKKRKKKVKVDNTWWKYLLVGVLMALGFLFKVPVMFELFTILVWLVAYKTKNLKNFVQEIFRKRTWLIVGGFLGPILLTIIYYVSKGAGESYLRSALGQNIGYLSSWEGSQPFYMSGLFARGMIMMLGILVVWLLRKKLRAEVGLVFLWFIGALFGSQLSGRPYPHYFIEILPPAVLLIGMMVKKKEWLEKIVGIGLLGLVVLSVVGYRFWYYKSLPYYKNFASYILGNKDRNEFYEFWGKGVTRNYEVANYIQDITEENERIFVWGTEPAIYVLSDRLPVGKYTVAYHISDFGAKDKTMELLEKEMPRVIVNMVGEKIRFDEFHAWRDSYYGLAKIVGDAEVYIKIDGEEMKREK